ncbi:helix-turn-helix transcriptional regulator [Ktedonobacter sp. SOSP1-52]|uniref:LuxR C-terminal-related transcriptional regulator n=1 Tax=Ktedonobacter sp. SOSP1-52 TaxID=2778366 RepID=UPI00191521DB|nr:LuxR C-terminal-related transcriptional regulator [Ktedonobacter sp. SOSP1-52]GHO71243.1 helix-turn-helix transcriptional regulator [Ktedonobacter sp. SOSP1-52]
MPKAALYRLTWVPEHRFYTLSEAHNHEHMLPFAPGSSEWFSWLRSIPSFTFIGQHGQLTVRQEIRGGTGAYWYAYRRHGDKMLKRYLGQTTVLTPASLEEAALQLNTQSVSSSKPEGSAIDPSQGRCQAPTSKAEGTSPEALPSPERTSTRHSASHAGTAPLALHNTHHKALDLLLATKLHMPRPRTQLVPRAHLVEHLQRGASSPLTLISAPAGFGKTTLLAQWQASTHAPVAWLSLEPEDNEPIRFFTYLLAALQTLDPHFGGRTRALLSLPQPVEPETVLAWFTHDLITWQREDVVLVLDDYHVITTQPIHHMLAHLVEHLSHQLHLFLVTRSDPPLPLARLRARGQLAEIRAAELRFGVDEAGIFLTEVMGLHLSQEEVTILQTRTEGWIAGLQLTALSLQGRADISSFLPTFTGNHRFVLDYLSEEVLSQQSDEVQTFLLQTSILERLTASLCDAVTGYEESQTILETLDRANLFVVALDDVRGWYRYHHLFANLLRSRLQQSEPHLLPELHRRASRWYEEHDVILEAVHHAILALDLDRTIRLIEEHRHSLALHDQARTVMNWLHTFPDELIRRHPSLCLSQGLLLMLTGQLPEALIRLQVAEQAASSIPEEHAAQTFLHQVAALQAYILFIQGDLESSVALAEQALDHLDHCPVEVQASTRLIAAHRVLLSGQVRQVEEQHIAHLVSALSTGNDQSAIEVLWNLTRILLHARQLRLLGRLRQAATVYEQLDQVQGEYEEALISPGSSFGLGELYYEWNDLDMAERLLERGKEALNKLQTLEASAITQGYATLALLHQARNKPTHALACVEELVRLAEARQFASAQLNSAAAVRARLALMQGNLTEAVRWAEASGLPDSDDLRYSREQEYLTFARVRIAQGRLDPAGPFLAEALRLLERLRADAEAKARVGSLLQILVLQALALFTRSAHKTQALAMLERALALVGQEGYIRLFVDEGELMVALLHQAYVRGIAPGTVETILLACGEQAQASPSHTFQLVEPLTERELTVFRLLVRGLSNAEIAQELIIAVGTVKRHINSIYGKLGVQSRTQAIAQAHAWHVL